MRLAVRAKRTEPVICFLQLDILGVCLKPLVDAGKSNQLQEATVIRTLVVLFIGTHGCFFHVSGPQYVAVKSNPVFDLEDMRYDRMVSQVLANVRRVDFALDPELG